MYQLQSLKSHSHTPVLLDLRTWTIWVSDNYDSICPRTLHLKGWKGRFPRLVGLSTFLMCLRLVCLRPSSLLTQVDDTGTSKGELAVIWTFCCEVGFVTNTILRVGEAAQGKEYFWLYWDSISLTRNVPAYLNTLVALQAISLINSSSHFPRQYFSHYTLSTNLTLRPTPHSHLKAFLLLF